MSAGQLKISALKFKGKTTNKNGQKNIAKPSSNPDHQQKQQPIQITIQKKQQADDSYDNGKTLAEKSFELIKKRRIIQKAHERLKITNKQKLDKWKKTLSKQPDHYDLAKIGQKNQKGY